MFRVLRRATIGLLLLSTTALIVAPTALGEDPLVTFQQMQNNNGVMPNSTKPLEKQPAPPAGTNTTPLGLGSATVMPGAHDSPGGGGASAGGAHGGGAGPQQRGTPARKRGRTGTKCARRAGRTVCKKYKLGRVVSVCSSRRSGKAGKVTKCTYFNSLGRKVRRCTFRRSHKKCTRVHGASAGARRTSPAQAHASSLSWEGFPSSLMAPVGKIEFQKPNGENYVCSGTVVTRTLVLTAAHCIYSTEHGAYNPLNTELFAPGTTWGNNPADRSSRQFPYGAWRANNMWVPNGYKPGSDESQDYGLIEFAPASRGQNYGGPAANGSYIGDTVEAWNVTPNIRWGGGARVYSVGYPASGYWGTADGHFGNGQYACDSLWDDAGGTGYSDQVGTGWELWTKCAMNGGSSGGPWFVQLSDGTWTIGGVNDTCLVSPCTPYSQWLSASYFDNRFLSFWNAVDAQRAY
jgi:hypothetical protein